MMMMMMMIYSHYDILSDIMLIIDHENIICRHYFHDIIMNSFPDIEEIRFFYNCDPHLHTHRYKLYYNILSDSMIIRDHGNICVDTIFMILSCLVFQILKKLGFSIMAVIIYIHTNIPIFMRQHFFDHENMCRHNFGDDIMHSCQYIEENRCFSNGGTNLHIRTIAQGRPEDYQVEFLQGPHGIVHPPKSLGSL